MRARTLIIILIFHFTNLISQDFEVKPMKLYFDGLSENSQTKSIVIKNFNSDSLYFNITFGNFSRDSSGKTIFTDNYDYQHSLTPYISIQNSYFGIKPLDSISIPITINIPDSIKSSLWSVIYIKSVNEQKIRLTDNENRANITISPQIAVKIIYNYPSTKNDSLSIQNIKVSLNEKTNTDNALIEVFNKGNTIFNGNVNLLYSNIKTPSSEKSFTAKVEIMPDSKRIIRFDLKEVLKKGDYAFSTIINNHAGEFIEGKQEKIDIIQ